MQETAPAVNPHEVGSSWIYLPEGARPDEPPVTVEIVGVQQQDGKTVTVWHVLGRGLDRRLYRLIDETGMYLIREERPDVILRYTPPLQERPGGPMEVGQGWRGETTVAVHLRGASSETSETWTTIAYEYAVIGSRTMQFGGTEVEAYDVYFSVSEFGRGANPRSSYMHDLAVVPYLGEVRTSEGMLLQTSNLLGFLKAPRSH